MAGSVISVSTRRIAPGGAANAPRATQVRSDQWKELAEIGATIQQVGQKIQAREDNETYAEGRAAFDTSLDKFELSEAARTDLHETDATGQTGFQTSLSRHSDMQKQMMETLGKKMNRRTRSAFTQYATLSGARRQGQFARNLEARRIGYRQALAEDDINTMIEDRAQMDTVVDFAQSKASVFPYEAQGPFMDGVKSKVLLARSDLDSGDGEVSDDCIAMASDKGLQFHDPETRRKLVSVLGQNKRAKMAAAEKEQEQRQLAAGNEIYANMATFALTEGQQGKLYSPADLAFAFMDGKITKTMYDAGVAILTQKKEPAVGEQRQAYKQAGDLVTQYKLGEISKAKAQAGLDAVAATLGLTKATTFMDRMNTAEVSRKDRLGSDGNKIATSIFAENTFLPATEREAALGEVALRLDQYLAGFDDDRPLKRAEVMAEALNITLDVQKEMKAADEAIAAEEAAARDLEGAPAGLEGIWPSLSKEQRKIVAGLSADRRKIFLEVYNRKPLTGPAPTNINDIPSSAFNK